MESGAGGQLHTSGERTKAVKAETLVGFNPRLTPHQLCDFGQVLDLSKLWSYPL